MSEKLLTVREVAKMLGINESEVISLAQNGVLPAYKVGGEYLRFKKEQIDAYMEEAKISDFRKVGYGDYPLRDRIADFFYFNDFYILSFLIILIMLFIIFKG